MITFTETIAGHAARLNTSYNFVRIRRRVLIARVTGQEIRRTSDDIPYHLLEASAAELCRTLKIRAAGAGRDEPAAVKYVPATDLPDTDDLAAGQLKQGLRHFGVRYGGEGQSRRTLIPPYGYHKTGKGHWLPHASAAEAIATAFELMVDPRFLNARSRTRPARISWSQVANALNEAGFCRKDGRPWQADDVRTLIRIPTYAGYMARKDRPIYRAQFIPTPIVDLATFVAAATSGQGRKGMEWLADLRKIVDDFDNDRTA
ncbi:MAG: hypothetical protein Kow0031_26240 [Anaerolineae bacterium]